MCFTMVSNISVNRELTLYLNKHIKWLNCLTTLKSITAGIASGTYLLLSSAENTKAG